MCILPESAKGRTWSRCKRLFLDWISRFVPLGRWIGDYSRVAHGSTIGDPRKESGKVGLPEESFSQLGASSLHLLFERQIRPLNAAYCVSLRCVDRGSPTPKLRRVGRNRKRKRQDSFRQGRNLRSRQGRDLRSPVFGRTEVREATVDEEGFFAALRMTSARAVNGKRDSSLRSE